jgi:hypothetical protein
MKKILAIVLVLTIVLGLCACGGSEEKKMEGLHIGYARQSIMPNEPVGMSGYGGDASRLSEGYLDIVYSTCIAFTDGDDTVLLYTEDLLGKGQRITETARDKITEATGIPRDRILFANTHSHNGPSMNGSSAVAEKYKPVYLEAVVKAAQEALADRAPATLYGAKVKLEGMNFVRHYLQQDGTISSANNKNLDLQTVVDHYREADNEMVLIKVDRGEEKKGILLMNWAAHPCYGGESNRMLTADYIGAARDSFEMETGMHFAFFQAAGGDVVMDSAITEKKNRLDHIEYGAALAKAAVEALPTMEKIEGQGVKTAQNNMEYACNHYGQDRLADAKRVNDLLTANPGADQTALAQQNGFYSISQVNGIINCATNPETGVMELNAVNVGGAAFVTVSWEMFTDTGKAIKAQSPYAYTMVLSCANGKDSYVPTADAYDYDCYERFVAYFDKGAAEAATDALITMLKSFQ